MFKRFIKKAKREIANEVSRELNRYDSAMKSRADDLHIIQGRIASNQQFSMNSKSLHDYEFKVFSQFGDDGIIQFLIKNIDIKNKTFIEFGVENFLESNTRFLMVNNNWKGFVMDCSQDAMNSLRGQEWFWRYDLETCAAFVTKKNINALLEKSGFSDVGLLHIDIDGNDYWILESIDFSTLNPSILIVEYNSVFGSQRAITIPYDESFERFKKHYSGLYWGASLSALQFLADKKGYALIGSNSAGNNAYFVRKDLLSDRVAMKSVLESYVASNYRESRDAEGSLSFCSGSNRVALIAGKEVVNVMSGELEKI